MADPQPRGQQPIVKSWSVVALVVCLSAFSFYGCSDARGSPAADAGKDAAGDDTDAGPISGGGPLVYLNNDLQRQRFNGVADGLVARVTGFSSIEFIREEAGRFTSELIAAPPAAQQRCNSAFPVSFSAVDLDEGSGVVFVLDACGNWLIPVDDPLRPPSSSVWSDTYPQLPTTTHLQHATVDGETLVIGGNELSLLLVRRNVASEWHATTLRLQAPFLGLQVANLFFVSTGEEKRSQLVVQGDRRLSRYELNDLERASATLQVLEQQLRPPFVTPYSGFDQLIPIPEPTCGQEALGIGLFENAREQPRSINHLKLGETTYDVTVVDDSAAYHTLATGLTADKTLLLFAIGKRDDRFVATLWRRIRCNDFEKLAEQPVDFDWKGPVKIVGGEETPVDHSAGVRVLAEWDTAHDALIAYQYDGYMLRVFEARADENTWSISENKHEIHVTRTDHAFVDD